MPTVPKQETRDQITAYAGQTIFTYNFLILDEEDIAVWLTPAGQTPDPTADRLTLNLDYTVTDVGNETGGTVILIVEATLNDIITEERSTLIQRVTDFSVGGQFTASAVNLQFDRLTMISQEIMTILNQRGLTYDVTDQLGTTRANNIMPVLLPQSGSKISILSKSVGGALVALQIDEGDDVNTLRSELASEVNGGDGALMVGYYDSSTSSGKTVKEKLDQIETLEANHTGFIMSTILTISPPGWVFLNGKTIGNASSGATERANADTQDLFELLWNNVSDTYAPVSGGRGANATSDFNANKTIQLLDPIGRTFVVNGTPSVLTPPPVLGEDRGNENVTLVKANLAPHVHSHTFSGEGALDTHGPGTSNNLATQVTKNTLDGSADGLASLPFDIVQPSLFLNAIIKL